MQKKILLLSLVTTLALFIVILIGLFNEPVRTNRIKEEVIRNKIEDFTKHYFRFIESVQINTSDQKISVSTSYIPEIGSVIYKEELYESMAYHALQIKLFFPEVNHFKYIVLWDDYTKQEAMTLTINESDIKQLEKNYYDQIINQNGDIETSFENVFSSIVETEESKSWRLRIDPNSDLP
jgi:hypothetical protein